MLNKIILNHKTVELKIIFFKTVLKTRLYFKFPEDIKYKFSILLKRKDTC
jgi:hypothetical protein